MVASSAAADKSASYLQSALKSQHSEQAPPLLPLQPFRKKIRKN